MPGPSRKPRPQKVLEGTFRKGRDGGGPPDPPPGSPDVPETVTSDPIALAEWNRLLRDGSLVMTEIDGSMLEATALAYSTFRQARAEIAKSGGLTYESQTLKGETIIRPHPATTIEAESWRRYVSGLREFGLSPATRAKVTPAPERKPQGKAGDRFF